MDHATEACGSARPASTLRPTPLQLLQRVHLVTRQREVEDVQVLSAVPSQRRGVSSSAHGEDCTPLQNPTQAHLCCPYVVLCGDRLNDRGMKIASATFTHLRTNELTYIGMTRTLVHTL